MIRSEKIQVDKWRGFTHPVIVKHARPKERHPVSDIEMHIKSILYWDFWGRISSKLQGSLRKYNNKWKPLKETILRARQTGQIGMNLRVGTAVDHGIPMVRQHRTQTRRVFNIRYRRVDIN